MHADYRPSWVDPPKEGSFWTIALGVALGIIVAALVIFGAWRLYTQYELRQALQMLEAQTKAAAAAADRRRQLEVARRDADEARRRDQLADEQRAKAAAAFEVQREQQRRDDAWVRFYQRPQRCVQPADAGVFTECANEHVRAKRRFEELWAAGKL